MPQRKDFSGKRKKLKIRQDENKTTTILFIIGIIPVIWLGLLIAPFTNSGLLGIINGFTNSINNPFNINFCGNSIKTILFLVLIYGIAIGVYYSSKRNYRKREEYGSASWGIAKQINKKYRQLPISENKILTQNVKIGLNGKKHRRNLNVLICGRKWCR